MLDLAPARWLWLPCGRTLPNTVALFRRSFVLDADPVAACGWILGDSRYRLWVNGERVQWGPAPADPRWPEADPLDLARHLRLGENVIAVEVLYFGHGEGTWVDGNPGFICQLAVRDAAGGEQRLDSGEAWRCAVDRSHRPGQHQQWFLRALQEVVDARQTGEAWKQPGFVPDGDWLAPRILAIPATKPAIFPHQGSLFDMPGAQDPSILALHPRSVPMLDEQAMPAGAPREEGRTRWRRDPEDWFALRLEGSLEAWREPVAEALPEGGWRLPPSPADGGHFLTFALAEQAVGWPQIEVEAGAGTIVEVLIQEGHDPQGPAWLDTHFHSWFRWTCRAGRNRIEPFDFFGLRWIQVHVRAAATPTVVRTVGLRRRAYPWPQAAHLTVGEPALQRLVTASLNTLVNSVQETVCDGFGRERQQYSGDCGHQLHAVRLLHGATEVNARFLTTWSQGQAREGWYLDCWPGYDRIKRVSQRQLALTCWGPLLDHAVGFAFDNWNTVLETGDWQVVAAPTQGLLRFADYLWSIRDADGMLPVEGLGTPSVWIDHCGFQRQGHKRLAFTLYAAGMLEHALAHLTAADPLAAARCRERAAALVAAAQRHHWCQQRRCFIDNLPWEAADGGQRRHDRTLAMAVLFGQCPGGDTAAAVAALATCPPELGFSYPANAGWRLWALAAAGRGDAVLADLRTRWAGLTAVRDNHSLGEDWEQHPDTCSQYSHCPVVPLYVLIHCVAGIRPTAPGFASCTIRPQLGDLPSLALSVQTPRGPLAFTAERIPGGHRVTVDLPPGVTATGADNSTLASGRHAFTIPS
jgi:alpha-L-rhamnosidase